jgi:hypothetical protein
LNEVVLDLEFRRDARGQPCAQLNGLLFFEGELEGRYSNSGMASGMQMRMRMCRLGLGYAFYGEQLDISLGSKHSEKQTAALDNHLAV